MLSGLATLAEGTTFAGDYRVQRLLAAGGMGAVYVVLQQSTGKERALKLMRPELAIDAEARRRFQQEAQIGARIKSEHVVEIHSAGVDEATSIPYLVMELLSGEDLAARVERGPLSLAEARDVFEQVCHAMAAAHDVNVVHRDLKPENVFLAESRRAGAGTSVNVKVLDFGIAKLAMDAKSGATTGMIGTPLWMAPEQADRGKVTPGADVWALGLMTYHALTGRYFWRAADDPEATYTQLLKEIVMGEIPAVMERAREQGTSAMLTPAVASVIESALQRAPSARPPHARAFWEALSVALGSAPPASAPQPSAPQASAPQASPRVVSAAALQRTELASNVPRMPPMPPMPPPPISAYSFGDLMKPAFALGLFVLVFGAGVNMLAMKGCGGRSRQPGVNVVVNQDLPRPRPVPTTMPLGAVPSNARCRLCTDRVVVDGSLDRETVVSAVEASFPALDEECIESHGRKRVRPATVTIAFVVKEGTPGSRRVEATTSTDSADECLVRAFSTIRFPPKTDPTEVSYTLRFDPNVK